MKKHLLLSAMGLSLLFCSCAEEATVTYTQQNGESCNEEQQCLEGLFCENGTCRMVCKSDNECTHKQQCINERCVALADGLCRDGWKGSNCDECATGYYGKNCQSCPACGAHGLCNDGLNGDGQCTCNSGWEGDTCEKKSACPESFTGENCDECLPGLFGPDCAACTCKNGTCSEGVAGNGHCLDCNSDWSGPDCDLPNECENGDANTGVDGDGHCLDCNSDWSGNDCDIADECKNGDANTGIEGDGHCIVCTDSRFTGENCDQCVDSHFTGTNCDECIDGVAGTMADKTGKSYKTVCINNNFWMAENMNYLTGNWYHANNSGSNDTTYGLLYDWLTALTVCPSGWHLPTKQEFDDLLTYVANNRTSSSDFLSLIAKSTAWTDFSNKGGDDFGFGALPAGSYYPDEYYNFGTGSLFWSSTGLDSSNAYFLSLGLGHAVVISGEKESWLSVRCVKD